MLSWAMILQCPGGVGILTNVTRFPNCQRSAPCLSLSRCHSYLCVFTNEFSELSIPTHVLLFQNILPSYIFLFDSCLYFKYWDKSKGWPQGEAVTIVCPSCTYNEFWEHWKQCSGNLGSDCMVSLYQYHQSCRVERDREPCLSSQRYKAGPRHWL